MPPEKSRDTEAQRILIRMMLDLHAQVTSQKIPMEETLVSIAIRMGQFEGRPMDASQIAAVTTLPRPSVHRHLSAILQRHRSIRQMRVGRRVVYFFEPPANEAAGAFFEVVEKLVRQAMRELSILDTSTSGHDA